MADKSFRKKMSRRRSSKTFGDKRSNSVIAAQSKANQINALRGWWLCRSLTEGGKHTTTDPDVPIIFQVETILCSKDIRVIGRVFNMTTVDAIIDNDTDGTILEKGRTFYSNLSPPKEFLNTDQLVHDLIQKLTTIRIDPQNNQLILSNGKLTAAAIRNPQGLGFYGQGKQDTDLYDAARKIFERPTVK